MNRFILTTALAALTLSAGAQKKAGVLSQSFELRYVTSDPKANGETDYKGATEWMTTDQRIDYLHHWQQYASKFFNDQSLAQQVVTNEEVGDAMKRLKPQPLPCVRQKLVLDEWRWAPSATHHRPIASQYRFDKQTYNLRLECSLSGSGSLKLMDGETMACSYTNDGKPHHAVFEGMAEDVRQLRNAPSIVIWQPSNHPSLTDWKSAMTYWHKVYDAIYPNDTTRLITPTADFRHTRVYNDNGTRDNRRRPVSYCDPVWTANRISRGSMDYPTGFGQDWEYLRRWPVPHKWPGNADIVSFLNSPDRAYFNFEQEETIGQMNWDLFKGSPVYKYHSYEWDYDEGSIGRRLSCDEWRESQAWQAFSAYECIRKMRWLDYDGLSWCCMWGGGNMGTYQKPLIDALGHKKLAFYAHRMGFQQVLAGSKDVDMVYGPEDHPTLTVLNLGDEQHADIILTVRDEKGKLVYTQRFKNITLPQGRTATDIGLLSLPKLPDGYYFFEYQVVK